MKFRLRLKINKPMNMRLKFYLDRLKDRCVPPSYNRWKFVSLLSLDDDIEAMSISVSGVKTEVAIDLLGKYR